VGERSPSQLVAAQFAQIHNVGHRGTVSSIAGGLTADSLVATGAHPVCSILIELPLQLLDCGDANVIEQLPA
jgi:hypothetical protein